MTIAAAITALSPSIWYPLDETSGTTATNHGTQVNDGTYSGSVTQGQLGPEIGTYATRLYTGGQIVSQLMDLTTFVAQTLGFFVSMDATGTNNTIYPIVSIGDPANRNARGPSIYEVHSSQGNPLYRAWWGGGTVVSGTAPYPATFWHWVVASWISGTNGLKIYIDGVLAAQATPSAPGALLATDPLLIRCDAPALIAHVCWWGSVLTQVQVQTVAAQMAPWPYTVPINTPPPAETGDGGGLTSGQAAQLTNIEDHTNDIPGIDAAVSFISDTVNHIKGVTDAMSSVVSQIDTNLNAGIDALGGLIQQAIAGVTATVGSGVDAVTQTIGQIFSWISNSAFVTGIVYDHTCEPIDWDVPVGLWLYGIELIIDSWPTEWTFTTPDNDYSIRDLAVINITRGGEPVARHGVHSKQYEIAPMPGIWYPPAAIVATVPFVPPGYHIHVDFAGGVCGKLKAYTKP